MRSVILTGVAAGVVALAAGLSLQSTSSSAPAGDPGQPTSLSAPPSAAAAPELSAAASLPITHVHLFSSGVGFFQRQGEVEGNARIDVTFSVQDINDLLKSMALNDLDGGRVGTVAYDSPDPIDKTLRSFAINFTGNPAFGQILNQARGEKVEVVLQQGNPAQAGTLTGTIVGVEKQKQAAGKEVIVEAEMLNLWCAEGMRSLKLADVQRIRFLNPALDAEVKRALDVLARTHDMLKKTVGLSFEGQGKRRVRVGYVVESPVWKTSYRLTLNKEGRPSLQGWAVVENPTDEDWKDVRLALVAGRPISFQMDLYRPLYNQRPLIELDLFASLRPPTHGGAMDWMALQRDAGEKLKPTDDRPTPGGNKPRPPVTAGAVGDFFQYVLDRPISLPRQKTALFPILEKDVEGTRVSIYNEATQTKYPLLGLRFKNTTGLHLMQGPITVFEDGSYGGDARVLDVQPGEERLISYAIDLGTEVEPRVEKPAERVVTVRIDKGILSATTKVREAKTYVAKNRSAQDRTLLIEHPYRPEFALVGALKPRERTRDAYRFEVSLPAGKTVALEVVEERTVVQEVVLTGADDQTVLRYVSGTAASAALKEALAKASDLKGRLEATRREIGQTERQLKAITDDQARLRANLERVPPTSEAYKRYLKKFDEQETEIEKLQDAIRKLQVTEQQQRKAYEDYLMNLSVE
jgi:hypothetical protein